MIIQQATIADAERVSPLFNDYRIFYEQKPDLDLAKRFIKERLEKDESVIYFATNESNNLLGFTQLYPLFSSVSAKRTWLLNDLFVAKEYRRLGVAKQLMNRAKQLAEETGVKGIGLQTAETNMNAQKLYESLGYVRGEGFYDYFLTL